jgi:putative (di)nucleoside polyphosphate hydrolase
MTLPYRPAAAVMLLNAENKVFVAQRIDSSLDAWQMPQGGLDPGEEAEAGALRELEEETGIPPRLVTIVARASRELLYDLPPEMAGRMWGGKYRGQTQSWFLARFLGTDADIDLETEHPEFKAFQWVDPWTLPDLIVPFKKQLYEDVLGEFAAHLPARIA